MHHREYPGGRKAVILPLLFGAARLGVGPIDCETGFDDVFDFPTMGAAEVALMAWDGTGEPLGWTRHPESGRRRPGGDPTKEFVFK